MTGLRFASDFDGRRAYTRRSMRRHGGERRVRPQAGARPLPRVQPLRVLIPCLILGLSSGCRPAPDGPRPTPIQAGQETLDAASTTPEPGMELRRASDRGAYDIAHYDLELDFGRPASGRFGAVATLRGDLAAGADRVDLDFIGLEVASVLVDGAPAEFGRGGSILTIGPFEPSAAVSQREIRIEYGGVPENGLFFGEDRDGEPAVFADNWPNRARWWFPSNDHPLDKATVRFEILAPEGYAVIGNGRLVETRPEPAGGTTWIWETDPAVLIPSYTMVVGMARFERRALGQGGCGLSPAAPRKPGAGEACADVSVWALAGDGDYGAERFARAPDMLDYYSELIGPYPYEKLAHVESSTRFGGMENSSAIFYGRGAWEERRMGEGVIAHETAHQWFGDAVSPASWSHLWVSEGFASYFSPLYFEARDGVEAFRSLMRASREVAVGSDVVGQAIVDSSSNQLFDLLNRNNYQKGAWVLHMLRRHLGDEAFFRGIRDYYGRHLHGVALTGDVRAAFERAAGQELGWFFDQWVHAPGHPQLAIDWGAEASDLLVSIRQVQPPDWPAFTLDLDFVVEGGGADGRRANVRMETREATLRIPNAADAEDLLFDPDVSVLATAEIRRR
ncbi:M1 family metallopeptidase [Candidatus Palauibacter sp.]|uniref:M1 family metallopeptidase n=1 Tax=Candidatus Palauibacter sp. TaxID=3101350 RepID=UPI003B5CFEF6